MVAVAQNQEVKGVVLSAADQQPLIGATVNVKGTTQAVFTGTDGSFTLKNVKPDAILQVRYIGFKSKEVSLSAAGHIILEEVANDL